MTSLMLVNYAIQSLTGSGWKISSAVRHIMYRWSSQGSVPQKTFEWARHYVQCMRAMLLVWYAKIEIFRSI